MSQKQSKSKPYKHLLVSLKPVIIGDWYIKASSLDGDVIMIITYNKTSLDSTTKFFLDDEEARKYVDSFTDKV